MSIDPDVAPLVVAFVALVVGLLGAGVSMVAILQRSRADARDALWERVKVAIAMSQSARPAERELGSALMQLMLEQGQLSREDAEVLEVAFEHSVLEGALGGAGDDELAAVLYLQDGPVPGTPLDTWRSSAHDGPTQGGTDV